MNETIIFFSEKTNFKIQHRKELRSWIKEAIAKEKFKPGNINIILCNDDFLLKLNKKFLKRNDLTDIITFPFNEDKNTLSGDLYISYLRVKDNAKKYRSGLFNELSRVIIHGILHLAGYEDRSEQEKKIIRKKEDEYLKILLRKNQAATNLS